MLQAKVAFGTKAPKAVLHDFQNSVYTIICERRSYILDDLTLNIKRELPGSIESVAYSIDGKIAIVTENNALTLLDLTDKTYSFQMATSESKIEAVKFSSLGLYLTAKLVNPYGVAVWMLDKPENLFTFNENLKFADFLPLDGSISFT